jgi:O-antigen ligase
MALGITVAVLVIGIVAEVMYAPRSDPGEEYRFAGTLHPNHTGLSAAMMLMCSLYLARRREDRRFLIFVVVGLVVIIMSKSRTALAGAIVGSAAFALAVRPLRQKLTLVVAVALVLGVAAVLVSTDAMPHLSELILLDRKTSDPTTLTGRTTIWHYVWGYISTDWGTMLAGYGYGGFWDKATAQLVSQRANFKLGEAHDDYLELITQLGLVGLFLYFWGLGATMWISISQVRRTRSVDAAFVIGLIAFTLVHSIAESAMTLPVFTTLVFWSVLGSAALTGGKEREIGGVG